MSSLMSSPMSSPMSPRQDVIVHTDAGAVRGFESSEGYRAFRGIPFAAPPLGHLRWAPPAPVHRWKGILDATEMKANCLQLPEFSPPQPRETLSEDCLTLNVWTPSSSRLASRKPLPVWFWVHGGKYTGGGSNQTVYNGKWNAMQSDVIVVVANYRLNIFGFLGSSALRARDRTGGGSTGNYGIQDQRAALRWVQSNIARFGGDPRRVMLGGQSAGGASVYDHLVRPRSWGLFARAVAMSGAFSLILPQPEPEAFERTYEVVVNATNCNDTMGRSSKEVSCLESLPADVLLHTFRILQFDPAVAFGPVVDGVDLTGQVASKFQRGEIAPDVPLIAGATTEDLDYPLWAAPTVLLGCDAAPDTCTRSHFMDFVQRLKPSLSWSEEDVDDVLQAYSETSELPAGGNHTHWYWAARKLGTDYTMICPAHRSAQWLSTANGGRSPAYLYLFAHPPDGPSGTYPYAAHHSSEIPFIFRVENADDGPDPAFFQFNASRERPLADEMANALITFAATGAPPSGWPAYERDGNQSWMIFGAPSGLRLGGKVSHGLKRAHCKLWDATADNIEGTFDASKLIFTASTLHLSRSAAIDEDFDDALLALHSRESDAGESNGKASKQVTSQGALTEPRPAT